MDMIGKTISHYKILEKLGEGGMGVVYKAEDTKLRRTVALKFLTSQTLGSEEERARFVNEAQAAAALDHPNICTIYEINEADDRTFIAMAYVEGQSLKEKIESGPLELDEALEIAVQVAGGLQDAHERGIVHRDIKSANIMVTEKGQAKIMDFGLAKFAGRAGMTKIGTTMGTVAYMSPEQARGEVVDHRTDLWSLGVVLYEMLSGQSPFKGEYEQAVIYSILNEDPESIIEYGSNLPLELEKIVKRCLTKDSKERYQAAADLQADLKRVEQDISSGKAAVHIEMTAVPHPFPKLIRRIAVPLGGVILVLLLLFLLPSGLHVVKSWLGFGEEGLVVLPFTLVGGDSADQAFCDGMAASLTSKLTQLGQFRRSLWVVPAIVVRKRRITSMREARQVFGINMVITGNMQRFGDIIRLTLTRVDVDKKTPHQLSSQPITDPIANLFTWQESVVIELAKLLDIEIQPRMRRTLIAGGTTVPGSYELYLRGRGYMLRYEEKGNLDTAINLFKRAIEQDSSYALAYAGLGEAYWQRYGSKDLQWVKRAISCCNRAIKLNDQIAPVYVTLGLIRISCGHYEEALQDFQRALELNPVNTEAYQRMAWTYERMGKIDQAEMKYQKAIRLQPKYWSTYNNLGVFYYRQGRFEEAVKQFQKVVTLTPGNTRGYNNLGGLYFGLERWEEAGKMFERSLAIKPDYTVYSQLGTLSYYEARYADAVRMYEKALELKDDDYRVWGFLAASYYWTPVKRDRAEAIYKQAVYLAEQQLEANPLDPEVISDLADYYGMMENSPKALSLLKQVLALEPSDLGVMFRIGEIYEQLGERETALKWIETALKKGYSVTEAECNPFLRELRADERFQLLLKNIKKEM
ncbi:MAG: protein kinase [Candidatus Marinimicrobia bacterium]|nr:protein kinase [Candidatus Neomarinimicrobiota bacterium]